MLCDEINIRIIVDNKGNAGLTEEHGFSVWIGVTGHKILFDTGQGKALVPNAAMLGCDLSQIDTLILSHGHYDHSGALSQLLQIAPTTEVFCHPASLLTRCSVRDGEIPRTVSMTISNQEALLGMPSNQIHWVVAPDQIIPDVGISGTIPRVHPMEDTGGPFFLDPEGRHPDLIRDDMAIWINSDRGLIIITGCCHSGLINTVEHVRSVSGTEKVFGIIGGLHLVNASRERLETTCTALRTWNPEFVIPCHCTGEEATAFLIKKLGPMVTPGYAGFELKPAG